MARANRREFLGHMAAVSAAAALPAILPSTVLARDGRVAPNEKIGIAGIGVGRQGQAILAQAAASEKTRIVAVADAYWPRAQEVAAKYGCAAYQDYQDLLARDDVDAILTATPDHWRALVVIHACQAGKDVYAEKPMCHTIREGRLMVEAVRKYGRVLQTGSQQRSMEPNRRGCELVLNGAIGRIRRVIAANYPSPWLCGLPAQDVPQGLDWDMWFGPTQPRSFHTDIFTPRANPGWISFVEWSGGEMTGWGSHGFDQVQWALGMDEYGPLEIWTEGPDFDPPTYTEPTGRGPGEAATSSPKVFMRYPGDTVMELGDGPPGGAVFIGDEGTIRIDRNVVTSDPPEIAECAMADPTVPLYVSDNHMENWLECIYSREKPVCDVEIGHRSSTICHLGNIARWVGRHVRWDPVAERFDDEEANRHLDRPRREGYELPRI
ncbi:MAG: Gfo/Idh/MocA family oxidoreductase [candidate division WS1 bacterium]|nr:Gfo/Idh/MocA family oxidoreductase [candidate division WS1 bacterium]